jgi:hypothetical protein
LAAGQLEEHQIGRRIVEQRRQPAGEAADAEAQHHELVDPQVIHQAEMVIGV